MYDSVDRVGRNLQKYGNRSGSTSAQDRSMQTELTISKKRKNNDNVLPMIIGSKDDSAPCKNHESLPYIVEKLQNMKVETDNRLEKLRIKDQTPMKRVPKLLDEPIERK